MLFMMILRRVSEQVDKNRYRNKGNRRNTEHKMRPKNIFL